MNKVNHSEIMKLGFRTITTPDSVFEAQHGMPYTIFCKDITKKIHVSWDQIDRELSLYVKENFLRKITLEELKFLIEIYGKR